MPTTTEIAGSIDATRDRFAQLFASNGWPTNTPIVGILGGYAPPVSLETIAAFADFVSKRIRGLTKAEVSASKLGPFLGPVPDQMAAINAGNLSADADAVVGGFLNLLQTIAVQLPPVIPKPEVDWEEIKETKLLPKDLARRLRAIDARLKELEPRSADVETKITFIEAAHAAADQLPTDLAELAEKRSAIEEVAAQVNELARQIEASASSTTEELKKIKEARHEADALVERSEAALRGATGVGLAAAFEKRKESLTTAAWAWTAGLLLALGAAFLIGAERVNVLKDVLISDKSATVIWVNALLAALGIGAPIWFAWLSTKQIWTNFRLAEDYAYKASVSKAYEGYRAEAVSIDPQLQTRLFESALTRLEEAPIRLLDPDTHASPLQEVLGNPALRRALENVPGIADKVIALIPGKGSMAAVIGAATTIPNKDDGTSKDQTGEV